MVLTTMKFLSFYRCPVLWVLIKLDASAPFYEGDVILISKQDVTEMSIHVHVSIIINLPLLNL